MPALKLLTFADPSPDGLPGLQSKAIDPVPPELVTLAVPSFPELQETAVCDEAETRSIEGSAI